MNFIHIPFSLNTDLKHLAAVQTNWAYRIIRACLFREMRFIRLQEACSKNYVLFQCGLSYRLATVEYMYWGSQNTSRQLAFLPETSFVNIPLI